MSRLLEEAEQLIPLWRQIRAGLDAFRDLEYSSLSSDERRYFDLLCRYAEAVGDTVDALVSRQRLMTEGSFCPDQTASNAAPRSSTRHHSRVWLNNCRAYNRHVANTFDRITQNPSVLAGRATIRGLRISVAHVVNLVANGLTPTQIVADLPDLEEEDVRQALAYAAALAQDELHTLRA